MLLRVEITGFATELKTTADAVTAVGIASAVPISKTDKTIKLLPECNPVTDLSAITGYNEMKNRNIVIVNMIWGHRYENRSYL